MSTHPFSQKLEQLFEESKNKPNSPPYTSQAQVPTLQTFMSKGGKKQKESSSLNGKMPIQRVPKKLKSLLDSTDINLVQLGATLMTKILPKDRWGNILTAFQIDRGAYNKLWAKKWDYKIEGDDIFIEKFDIWRLHHISSTPSIIIKDPTKILKLSNNIPHFKFPLPYDQS